MSSLMLHCGAASITRNALAALPIPEALGPRHVVRPFTDDIDLVEHQLNDYGLCVYDQAFGVTHDGNRFFGVLEVAPLEGEYISKDYGLMVGLRGSYDQSMSRGLAVGSRVFVCDNMAFSGEVSILTRQTTHIADRLPKLMRDAVARIPQLAEHQHKRFDAFKMKAMTPRQGDAMIVELCRRDIINPSIVGRVIKEWDTPSHEEHAEDGYTVWRMHNAVTESLKPSNPGRFAIPAIWERTTKMTNFFDEVVGL
jgi:hypothetical protein